MQHKTYKLVEFFLLFILFPTTLPLSYALWIKGVIGLLGFAYIIWVLVRIEKIRFFYAEKLDWKSFWKRIAVLFPIIIFTTTGYVWLVAPQHLFFVPLTNPLLFFFILLVYSVLSVWPQEILYRTFFFKRYEGLFKSKELLTFVNGIAFCLAHLFFRNTLVLILTFIGGIIFGLTFLKFKSTTLVTIEHALYGNWLFTVGMGQMLGFPGMND
ncbi:MAG: CPBP family intramembrane glutamic endopeptidase [Flavobacteriaceae bacterium]